MERVVLDGESLTIEQVIAVAYGQPGAPRVVLSDAAKANVMRAAEAVQQLLAEGRIVYGITTGFGAFKSKIIPPDQVEQLQHNILVSHAVGV
ncbi:MAG: aromatic amino acid lyase, partial [Anaerolineae bacterium]|nr:aromatic amino acid lyase [Anaerolineae bacterium]